MILFIDGQLVLLTVQQNIELYYNAYIAEFGDISRTRWEGSKEYEIAYANAERDFQNGVTFEQTLQKVFDSISEINEEIKRPAVLHSRVSERFLEAGYIATLRLNDLAQKGIVAICVDYVETPEDNVIIAELIVNEMLPAGQHMEGTIVENVVISNGQSIAATWKTPEINTVDWKISLTVDRNSQYAVDDVDSIVERFLANFNEQNKLGSDITPETYYQIATDAPWASKIVSTYDLNGSLTYVDTVYAANFDDRFDATLTPANVTIIL